MIFLWSERNREHLEKHDISPFEAQTVVQAAQPPYPEDVGDDKHSVWGRTKGDRFLQVIFVHVPIEKVEPDEFEALELHEQLDLEAGAEAVRVIHARDLTQSEKRRIRRRKR